MRGWPGTFAWIALLGCFGVGCFGQASSPPPEMPEMPAPVPDTQKITLTQALAQAQQNSPLLAAAGHEVAGAKANLSGQRAPVNPILNLTAITNTPDVFDPTDPTKYGLVVTLETSGRQRWRTHQAHAQLLGTEADAATTQLSVRQSVANAYIDLQVANRTLETEREAYATAARLNDLTEKQFQLGQVSEASAIRTRIALTQEDQNLLKAVEEVNLARANLNVQMGRTPETPVDASDPLTYNPLTLQLEDLQRQAVQFRPELRSAEANRSALQAAVSLQRSQYYPDLVIGTNPLSARNGEVEIGVSWPLFDLGSIRGQVRKAQEDVKAQEATIDQTRQTIRLEVQAAYLAVMRAQRLIRSFQDGILPRSASLLERVEKSLTLGASSILDVIDAQQTYRATRNDYDAALGDYRRAVSQLERAIGAPMPLLR